MELLVHLLSKQSFNREGLFPSTGVQLDINYKVVPSTLHSPYIVNRFAELIQPFSG